MSSHYIYTIGLPPGLGNELYQFDAERSKLGSAEQPVGHFVLTRPLSVYNPITAALPGTRFQKLIVRQYDQYNNLLKLVEYNDVKVLRLVQGPDLVLEFTYKP
jgi:hypothetical protein